MKQLAFLIISLLDLWKLFHKSLINERTYLLQNQTYSTSLHSLSTTIAIRPGYTSHKVQYISNICWIVGWTNQTLTFISDCRSSETVNNTSIFRYLLNSNSIHGLWYGLLNTSFLYCGMWRVWNPHGCCPMCQPCEQTLKGPNMFRYGKPTTAYWILSHHADSESALSVDRNGLFCSVNSGFGWEDLYFVIQGVHVNRAIVQLHPFVLPEPAPNKSGSLSSLWICMHYAKRKWSTYYIT